MFKIILVISLVILALARDYPVYLKCDEKWANEPLGTSTNETICSHGSLITSVAMGLKAIGKDFDPSSLNKWLIKNRGYIGSNLYIWASVNPLGLIFQGYVGVSQIRASFDLGRVVLIELQKSGDWVILTGHDNYTVYVNDPVKGATEYDLTDLNDGNSGVYIAPDKVVSTANNWFTKLFSDFYSLFKDSTTNQNPTNLKTERVTDI